MSTVGGYEAQVEQTTYLTGAVPVLRGYMSEIILSVQKCQTFTDG